MVCKTWRWSYRFGGDASFSKSDEFGQNSPLSDKKQSMKMRLRATGDHETFNFLAANYHLNGSVGRTITTALFFREY